MSSINQIVILAGGKGTRMGEMTYSTPKPMVEIGGKPVLVHLMEIFDSFDNFEYLICTCLLYTSPSPRDKRQPRMPSSA